MFKHNRRKHKAPAIRAVEHPHFNMKDLMAEVKLRKASFAYKHELLLHHQKINYQN